MTISRIVSYAITIAAILATVVQTTDANDRVKKINSANQALEDGKIDEALAQYQSITPEMPDDPFLAYNNGVALYRKGQVDQAGQLFAGALNTDDPELAAKASFNLGNCNYASALQLAEANRSGAIELMQNAIAHYRSALHFNSADTDARTNIELANRLIKKLQAEENQEQEKEQQQEPQHQDPNEPDQNQNDSSDLQDGESGQEESNDNGADEQKSDANSSKENNSEENQIDKNKTEPGDSQKQPSRESESNESESNESESNESKSDESESGGEQDEDSHSQKPGDEAKSNENDPSTSEQQGSNQQTVEQQNDSDLSERNQQPQRSGSQTNDELNDGQQPQPGEQHSVSQPNPETGEQSQSGNAGQPDQSQGGDSKPGNAISQLGEAGLKINKEEAMKMLQAIRDRDLKRRTQKLNENRRRHRPVDRDW